jgi:crossover junction endodeoxyribonuclease RuvC
MDKSNSIETDRVILGIDPGTLITGYGVIHVKGKNMEHLAMGVIKLNKIDDHLLRIKEIFDKTLELIQLHKPDEMAIEAPFFGKNVQSMLKLGRAQGVSIAAALSMNIAVTEYSPKKIKQSLTGNGNASKEQVAAMINSLLKINLEQKYLDATDGMAVAICHYFQKNSKSSGSKSFSGWDAYLKANPNKISKTK